MVDINRSILKFKDSIVVNDAGVCRASAMAVASLIGITPEDLNIALRTGRSLQLSKLSQSLEDNGFRVADLSDWDNSRIPPEAASIIIDRYNSDTNDWNANGIPDIAIAIIIDYFAHDAKFACSGNALTICRKYSAVGIRAWMQILISWDPTVMS
jgi:hypothetical protein